MVSTFLNLRFVQVFVSSLGLSLAFIFCRRWLWALRKLSIVDAFFFAWIIESELEYTFAKITVKSTIRLLSPIDTGPDSKCPFTELPLFVWWFCHELCHTRC